MPHMPTTEARKGEKLAHRSSGILAALHQGDMLDKHQLAQSFGVDVRTIERDLGERLQGIAVRTAEGQQLYRHASSTIPTRRLHDYAQLAGTDRLFPDDSLRYLLTQLDTPAPERPVHVQPVPQEDLRPQGRQFAQLEDAVRRHHACRFHYKGKPRQALPYRLIHKHGVWYLAAEEAGRLKNFSVARIEALEVDEASRFTPNPAHYEYINRKEDVWFAQESTEVRLRVSPEMAHYFSRRPLLPEQQQYADEDGSLIVTARIDHINQLLPVVRYWLPHVRIVQPAQWHEELMAGMQDALTNWKSLHRISNQSDISENI